MPHTQRACLPCSRPRPPPLHAPQQAAPQQVPAAESTAATTREQQALDYLAMLKKTQDEFCGCAFTVPIMPPGDEPGQPITVNSFYFTMPISSTPVAAGAGDAEANTQAEHAAVLPQSVPILQADAIAAMTCNMTPAFGDVCFGDFSALQDIAATERPVPYWRFSWQYICWWHHHLTCSQRFLCRTWRARQLGRRQSMGPRHSPSPLRISSAGTGQPCFGVSKR